MTEHFSFSSLPPLSLYIHIPWCVRKCPYCDFNSHQARGDTIPEQRYVDALLQDLTQELPQVWGRSINTIFFGGGTPSMFSADAIDRLLCGIRALLPLSGDIEITLEANPGTTDSGRFIEYRDAGINRLSIGVQSFADHLLANVGRIHDGRQAEHAVHAAINSGIDNINVDLMFGLPHQSVSEAIDDIQTALSLAPTHISHYQLTLEPNTLFHASPPQLPDNDLSWEMQHACTDLLAHAGYAHYEVSAFARSNKHCRHNLNYWQYGDYLGIGAGAHGKITNAQSQTITRYWKLKQPAQYLANAHSEHRIGGTKQLTPSDTVLEFMMNALRLRNGFDIQLFIQHTGLDQDRLEASLHTAIKNNWIDYNNNHIRATELGQQFLNDLLTVFVPDDQ